VWLAATLGVIATAPGQSFSISLFINHYITDFGLDRTTVSGLYGLGTFTAALSLTWVGRRIDRHGNRLMSILIASLFGAVLLACSLITGPFTMLISFVAIRGLGQGSMGLVSTTAVAQWFQRRRGWMMGLVLVGFALFQRLYVPWMQRFIEEAGWRAAWIVAGTTLLLVVAPLMGTLLRDRPEDFGLVPDGDALPEPGSETVLPLEDNWQLGEAMRTPIFWAFTYGRMLAGAWGTALIFHQISIFEGLGYEAVVAATTYGQIALMTAACTLFSGWMVDRVPARLLIVTQTLALAVACGLAMIMSESWLLILYTAAFGVFMGVGSVFDGTVWVNIYGRQHQGAIRGFVATALVAGTSIGPIVFGLAFDHLGSYDLALIFGIVLALAAATLALVIPMPTRDKL
jgi:MFS family permease